MKINLKAIFRGRAFNDEQRTSVVNKYMERGMTIVVEKGATDVKMGIPVGVTGNARSGVRGEVIHAHRGVISETGPAVRYIDNIEGGRKPTESGVRGVSGESISFEPIKLWVKRIIKPGKKKLDSVAFLVYRKIHEKGYEGVHAFEKAEEKLKPFALRIFKREIKSAERELSDV